MSKFSICEIEKDLDWTGRYECSTHGVEYRDNDKNPSEFCPVGKVESDFDKVKELLAEQEKKTKILLDALERITNLDHVRRLPGCWCHVETAQKALEEYKKE
jgi:hypothetical protein